jgi:hypothetical protein
MRDSRRLDSRIAKHSGVLLVAFKVRSEPLGFSGELQGAVRDDDPRQHA